MFFKDYLISVATCLEAKLQGYKQQKHSGDIGELCEFFIRDFLQDSFSGNYRIFRGGQVINSENKKSEQIDIILCSQSSIKIFSDKGIYPIETVFGVFNIKKELTHTNLFSTQNKDGGAIKNLQSIPKNKINLNTGFLNQVKVLENFNKRFPYKIIYAFEGKIVQSWEDELNQLAENKDLLDTLPDIIVVNKQGMIKKCSEKKTIFETGEIREKYFHFTSFETNKKYHAPYLHILSELSKNANWQYLISPAYENYFNQDLT